MSCKCVRVGAKSGARLAYGAPDSTGVTEARFPWNGRDGRGGSMVATLTLVYKDGGQDAEQSLQIVGDTFLGHIR